MTELHKLLFAIHVVSAAGVAAQAADVSWRSVAIWLSALALAWSGTHWLPDAAKPV